MVIDTITMEERKLLAVVFSKSLFLDPMYNQIFPEEEENLYYFTRFWEQMIDYTYKYGYVMSTDKKTSVLCLLPPSRTDFSLSLLWGTRFGIPLSVMRFPFAKIIMTFSILFSMGAIQSRLIPEPHWYLMSLGVLPEEQGKGKGKKLLTEMLEIVTRDSRPVYLETETEKNVSIYEKYGFRVERETTLKRHNLHYYLMIKR